MGIANWKWSWLKTTRCLFWAENNGEGRSRDCMHAIINGGGTYNIKYASIFLWEIVVEEKVPMKVYVGNFDYNDMFFVNLFVGMESKDYVNVF